MIKDDKDPKAPKGEGEADDVLETALEEQQAEVSPKSHSKSPWKAFIFTGLLASLIGAVGGGYGVYTALKTQAPKITDAPQVDLSPLEAKLTDLTKRLDAAEASVEKAINRPVPKPTAISEPVDLSGLESRLDTLENAPSPEIDPAALTALKSAQEDGFEWPDTSDLEKRLSELESASDEAPQATLPDDLLERLETLEDTRVEGGTAASDEERLARFEALESRLSDLENRPAAAAKIERVSILAFPKKAMVEAVEDNIEGGLFKKTLSKHVRVKDENDPIALIEGIEADIEKGRLQAAIKKYDRLPEPIRVAGQAWYESVKASL